MPLAFSIVNRFCMVHLYGRAERFTTENGGLRSGHSSSAAQREAPAPAPAPAPGATAEERQMDGIRGTIAELQHALAADMSEQAFSRCPRPPGADKRP